jgi:hypothetical protein
MRFRRELQRPFHVSVTTETSAAHDFFCDCLEPHDPFPSDLQWIYATSKLVNQINRHLQRGRAQEARSFGIIYAFTQLIKPLSNCPGLSEAQQIDFIEKIDTPALPSNDIPILEGDPFVSIRNIDTRSGLVKGRRCRAIQIKSWTVVFQFEDGETRALTRIPMEKTSNGMKFIRCQLPLRLIFAGTVHRSQGKIPLNVHIMSRVLEDQEVLPFNCLGDIVPQSYIFRPSVPAATLLCRVLQTCCAKSVSVTDERLPLRMKQQFMDSLFEIRITLAISRDFGRLSSMPYSSIITISNDRWGDWTWSYQFQEYMLH